MSDKTIYCRWSPTLGALEDTAEKIWGTPEYEGDRDEPAVFFGLYGFPDFYTLWRHRGKKWILWAGSDIVHFRNGYWLEEGGGIKIDADQLSPWINKYCENWCENEVERQALEDVGIQAQVCPSFLGDIEEFEEEFKRNDRPKVYLSASPGREAEYGWKLIEEIAPLCNVDFYLYGSPDWESPHHNVFSRGRVPKEQMNDEVKNMQCGLRLNEFDGFSEITAKSILWGQYPIVWSTFQYPGIESFSNKEELIKLLNELKDKVLPNPKRAFYRRELNQFPWNTK